MSLIRSDVIVLPPGIGIKRPNSIHSVVTGAAASTPIFSWPAVSISSSTDATPIVVTMASGHGFLAGDTVTIASHTTNVGANGTFVVSAANATTITLTGSVGSGAGSGGASGTVNFESESIVQKTKVWVTFQAKTADAHILIGAAATARTTATNALLIPLGTSVRFLLTPSIHTNVDAFCATAGTLAWWISSPPGDREVI